MTAFRVVMNSVLPLFRSIVSFLPVVPLSMLAASSLACAQDRSEARVEQDRWAAEAAAAEKALARGDRSEAAELANRIVTAFQRTGAANSSEYTSVARAWIILSTGNAEAVRSALRAYDRAISLDSGNTRALLGSAALLLDKYNAPDARATYELILRRSPDNADALLGLARVEEFEGKGGSLALAQRSLSSNSRSAAALAYIARMHLDAEEFDSARAYAIKAIAADSTEIAGWGILGATAWVIGDSAGYRRALSAATALQPSPSTFHLALAEAAVRQRRYSEAVELAKRAIEYDSLSVSAIGLLGTTQLRIGQMQSGRVNIERAFSLDPFNLWHKNTLDLLDKMQGFRTIRQGRFELVAPESEADLLSLYILPLLERAFDSLSVRYQYKPVVPVRLEMYRQHADFSVRTVGLNGLGALGVSFGNLLAMDAPNARNKGSFNWGSTAWHELTHTFTLGASGNRVPRWLSEGLSVVEERRAGSGWGARMTLPWLIAYSTGKVRPVSQLNDGFLRPRYPEETVFSYYQASLFCEWVESIHGMQAIRGLLSAYRSGLETPEVFQSVLRLELSQVDAQFNNWLQERFATEIASIKGRGTSDSSGGAFAATMKSAVALTAQNADSARVLFERARAMFPSYSGEDGPDWFLARLALNAADTTRAIDMLASVTGKSETAWDANMLEAELREKRNDRRGAMAALERLVWIWPYDFSVHERFAENAMASGEHEISIRERKAVLASGPADPLAAGYELARAFAAAGRIAEARRELLRVLEEAPGYEKAQALLLEISKRAQGRSS